MESILGRVLLGGVLAVQARQRGMKTKFLAVLALGVALIAPAVLAQSTNSWVGGLGKWETGTNWSLGIAPSSGDLADLITNGGNNTATIDATTATNFPGTMTVSNLTVIGSSGSTNALILDNAGTAIPLQILADALTLDTNAFMVVNNSAVLASNSTVSVGYSGANCTLIVSNGGAVYDGNGYVGDGSGSSNNTVLVSGAGSVWSNSAVLTVGYSQTFLVDGLSGSGNQLIITNGGAVSDGNGYIGDNSENDAVVVSDNGSVWNNNGHLYVGYEDDSDQGTNILTVINGGAVYSSGGSVGGGPNGQGDAVLVTGSGSVWNNSGSLTVGDGENASGNTLTIANGGAVFASDLTVNPDRGYENSMLVTGTGSVCRVNGQLELGNYNGDSSLTISGGGAVYSGSAFVAADLGDDVLVTDSGSVWDISGSLTLGADYGYVNTLTITNGGAVYSVGGFLMGPGEVVVSGEGSVWNNSGDLVTGGSFANGLSVGAGGAVNNGNAALASGTYIEISDPGSVWNNSGNLTIYDGTSQLTISGGGSVLASNVYVSTGSLFNSGGEEVTISGGALYVTNALGNGVLNVLVGTLSLNSGTVTVDRLVATNGGSREGGPGIVSFTGGSLNTKGTTVSNGVAFVVGDGTDAATFQLDGGVHSFANNLEISNNATLSGCGTVNGNVVLDPGGTVLADCGGTLTLTGIVTNNGSIIATNGTTIDFLEPVAGTGTIIYTDGSVQFSVVINTGSSPANEGSTSGAGTYYIGSNATVCASASGCYSFVNWTDQNSNVVSASACYTFVAVTNETLTATFSPNSYAITASPAPSGGGTASGTGTYPCGTNLTVVATPNSCFNFVNWTDQNSNVVSMSPSYSFIVSANLALVANFAIVSYTINTSASPSVGGSTSGGGTVACGSNVTVCATANSCYNFVNWTDQNNDMISTSTCYSFTAASNETLVANFALVGVPTNGNLTVLWTFPGGTNGANPEGPLVQGSDGNFYGTTVYGGPTGSGTVFRITPGGNLTNLHLFGGSDGAYPSAALVQGSDGNFYGTTAGGGARGYGTVFRISPSGALTTLHSFTNGLDGSYPYCALIQASDGNFYGTTYEGGSTGAGTVFRMSPGGSLSNLWSFTGDGGGIYPFAGLIQGSDGNFYGTTTYGSTNDAGMVFRISPGGGLTNLHSFVSSEGSYPYGGLVEGSDGNFYGTTYQGGANGYGSVYRITPSGNLTDLWSFTNGVDGGDSFAGLVPGSDGNFYGTTFGSGEGPSSYGTVFQITPAGNLTNLWEFTGCGDGGNPYAGLVQANDGSFYGVTYGLGSGPSASGTVFRINAGLCANGVNTSSAPPAGGLTSGGGIFSCGSNVTVCASPNTCYSFVNWTDQNSNVVSTSACYTFVSVTNEALTANFSVNTYTITASASPSGGGSASGGGTYPCGTNLTVVATANSCFSFVNWTDQNSNVVSTSPSYSFIVSTNQTFVANCSAVSYTINISSSPSAGGATSGGGTVPCGSNAMVCATANPCYSFVNWTDQKSNVVSSSACYTFLASSNQTLAANFAPISYTITVTNLVAGGGSVSGGGTVACGSNVTVCASPSFCYSFVNWIDQSSNVVSTSACFTFPAAANEALVGDFALISYGSAANSNLTNLWSFTNGQGGANPYAGLVQGRDGNFYGTTSAGGASGNGTVFRIGRSGNLTNLWSFTGGSDGANPVSRPHTRRRRQFLRDGVRWRGERQRDRVSDSFGRQSDKPVVVHRRY